LSRKKSLSWPLSKSAPDATLVLVDPPPAASGRFARPVHRPVQSAAMPRSLRAVAFLAGVCVLYVLGYVAMTVTAPPWGLVWVVPLAVAGGVAWHLLERLDSKYRRRTREDRHS
jgi:hypothetical protein